MSSREQRSEFEVGTARRREDAGEKAAAPPRRAMTLSEARAAVLAARQRLAAAQQGMAYVGDDGDARAVEGARKAREASAASSSAYEYGVAEPAQP